MLINSQMSFFFIQAPLKRFFNLEMGLYKINLFITYLTLTYVTTNTISN